MAKDFARAFYKSKRWQECRAGYISSRISMDGGLCERCHDKPGYICHHKEYISPENINDPQVLLSWDNLEYVCKECHDNEHLPGHDRAPLLCGFDEKGRPVNAGA